MNPLVLDGADVMVDIELMGAESTQGAIVSIAACDFKPVGGETPTLEEVRARGFNQAVGLKSAMNAGLKIDADTIRWWFQQSQPVRDAIFHNPISLREALAAFRKYLYALCGANPKQLRVWAMPAAGDLVSLENAYLAAGSYMPWINKNRRCLSTLKRVLPVGQWPSSQLDQAEKHIAIVDVHRQIVDARHACRLLATVQPNAETSA